MSNVPEIEPAVRPFDRVPTGIPGLDDVLHGGLPKNRVTLIGGDTGSGKSMLALECLVNGAAKYGEPGIYVSFDTPVALVRQDLASMAWDIPPLVEANLLRFQYFGVLNHPTIEVGEFTLDILLHRLEAMVNEIGATRVVLDTTEALFSVVEHARILRFELRRLFRWFIERNITLIVTVERPAGKSAAGIEEFASDCVIHLEQKMQHESFTRRLHVVKYRGSAHGMNSYPYTITSKGNEVYPITSIGLAYQASEQRQALGIPDLDEMLGNGVYVGSSILISGTTGSGKSSFVGHFADAVCRRGERCLYLAYEESEDQICRNMRSLGLDLDRWRRQGLLHFQAQRPTSVSLERHLTDIILRITEVEPSMVIIDPISNFVMDAGDPIVKAFLMRLIDVFKTNGITSVFTTLIRGSGRDEETAQGVSSIMDSWISLELVEQNDERNRVLKIFKSRGSAHSNQLREFVLSHHGITLKPVFLGAEGVVTGSQRLVYENRIRAEEQLRREEIARLKSEVAARQSHYIAEVEHLRSEHDINVQNLNQRIKELELGLEARRSMQDRMLEQRNATMRNDPSESSD